MPPSARVLVDLSDSAFQARENRSLIQFLVASGEAGPQKVEQIPDLLARHLMKSPPSEVQAQMELVRGLLRSPAARAEMTDAVFALAARDPQRTYRSIIFFYNLEQKARVVSGNQRAAAFNKAFMQASCTPVPGITPDPVVNALSNMKDDTHQVSLDGFMGAALMRAAKSGHEINAALLLCVAAQNSTWRKAALSAARELVEQLENAMTQDFDYTVSPYVHRAIDDLRAGTGARQA